MTADWTVRPAHDTATREIEPPCRCGWVDDKPHGVKPVRVPVLDLRDTFGVAGFDQFGAVRLRPTDPRVAATLQPYQRPGSGVLVA